MRAEVFIKDEAKSTLRNGNWVKAVAAIILLCLIPLMGVFVAEISYALASSDGELELDALSSSPLLTIFFILFQLIAVVAVVLLSPLMNGCARLFGSMADKKNADFADIFYFFETKQRYISAVKFMLGILVKGIITVIVSLIPSAIAYVASNSIYNENFARNDNLGFVYALNIVAVVLLVVGVIAAICFLLRYLFAVTLFSYYGYDEKQSMQIGGQVAKKHTKNLVNLTVSFIPWILLLFFVVPFLYVFPYMACAYAVSVKYLFDSYGLQFDSNTEVNSAEQMSENNHIGVQNYAEGSGSSNDTSSDDSFTVNEMAYTGTNGNNVNCNAESFNKNTDLEEKTDFSSDMKDDAAQSSGIAFGNFRTDNEVGGDV